MTLAENRTILPLLRGFIGGADRSVAQHSVLVIEHQDGLARDVTLS